MWRVRLINHAASVPNGTKNVYQWYLKWGPFRCIVKESKKGADMENIAEELRNQGVGERYISLILSAIDDIEESAYNRGYSAGYADGDGDGYQTGRIDAEEGR